MFKIHLYASSLFASIHIIHPDIYTIAKSNLVNFILSRKFDSADVELNADALHFYVKLFSHNNCHWIYTATDYCWIKNDLAGYETRINWEMVYVFHYTMLYMYSLAIKDKLTKPACLLLTKHACQTCNLLDQQTHKQKSINYKRNGYGLHDILIVVILCNKTNRVSMWLLSCYNF